MERAAALRLKGGFATDAHGRTRTVIKKQPAAERVARSIGLTIHASFQFPNLKTLHNRLYFSSLKSVG
jgi:hypothetical protein